MSDIVTIRYRDEHQDVWNQYVKNAKNSLFLFDRQYMDYHRDRFTDHSLMFYSDDDLIAVLPACETGDELVSHGGLTYGGLLIDSRMKQHNVIECMERLVEYAGEKGIKKLIVNQFRLGFKINLGSGLFQDLHQFFSVFFHLLS